MAGFLVDEETVSPEVGNSMLMELITSEAGRMGGFAFK